MTPTQPPAQMDVDALAQEIRRVDGKHKLGAGALAEALLPFIRAHAGAQPPAHDDLRAALREYADLQDMVNTSGGTFPVRLNGAYSSARLRELSALSSLPEAGEAVGKVVAGFSDALGDSLNVARWTGKQQPEIGTLLYTTPQPAPAIGSGHYAGDGVLDRYDSRSVDRAVLRLKSAMTDPGFNSESDILAAKAWRGNATNVVRQIAASLAATPAAVSQPAAMEWAYCPECGSSDVRHAEGSHKQCAVCLQEWFADVDYIRAVRANLADWHSSKINAPAAMVEGLQDYIDRLRQVVDTADMIGGARQELRWKISDQLESILSAGAV